MVVALVALAAALQSPSPAGSPNVEGRAAALAGMEMLLRNCLEKTESLARLDCYDRAARALTAPQAAPATTGAAVTPPAKTGKWKIDTKVNPLDDTKTYTAFLKADGALVTLILRCLSGETDAFIGWLKYLGRESAQVTLRLGTGTPVTKSWSLSSDHSASFYPDNDRQFIEELATADKLVAQVTPYSSGPITAVFDLAGIGDVVAGLRETCAWKD